MFFSESEGTDINFSESEGTDINLSESEGTDIGSMSIKTKVKHNNFISIFCLFLFTFSQLSYADTAYLYLTGDEVYQGLIVDSEGRSTQLIKGIIEDDRFVGFVNNTKSVDDGTGDKSVDDGTGDKSVDDGTGDKSVDDGTGGKSVDDGTGGKSVDDGAGGKSVDDGTGDLISINMLCNKNSSHNAQIQFTDTNENIVIDSIYLDGEVNNCNANNK